MLILRSVLVFALAGLWAPAVLADDWPQWRGPAATGVSEMKDAPTEWSPTGGVGWRTEIEGHGISSPVTVGDRVYVTTAVGQTRRPVSRIIGDVFVGVVAVVGVPLFADLEVRRRRGAIEPAQTGLRHYVAVLDDALVVGLALAVGAYGILAAFGPGVLDVTLNAIRDVGVAVARELGREHTNLWFLDWDETTHHNVWMISSGASLMSLALLPFVCARSSLRAASALVLIVATAVTIGNVPWNTAYGSRYPVGPLFVWYLPAVASAAWHLFAAVVNRHRRAGPSAGIRRSASRMAVPAFLGVGFFASPNTLPEREMVARRVVCLDARTGTVVWQRDVFITPPEQKFSANSHATPTPVIAGDTIVAAFGPGIAGLTVDGGVKWKSTFPKWIESSIYGAGSSPVVSNGAVFVTNDREYHEGGRQSWVRAYAISDGAQRWSIAPAFAHDGYATPGLYHDAARPLLVALTSKAVVGYDVADGSIAWKLKIPVSTPIPTAIIDGHRLFLTGGKGPDGYTAAYRINAGGPVLAWASRKHPADVASPVLYKERLFTVSSSGIMVCYDAADGTVLWKHRLEAGTGVFYASLVAAENKIYATRSDGTTFIVAAEDVFRLVAAPTVSEEVFATPAFGGDCLYLRTASALYCIRSRTDN